METKKDVEDICFICSYGGQRIEECKQCLFNVLKQDGNKRTTTENPSD